MLCHALAVTTARAWAVAIARLTAFALALSMVISRAGLVIHEAIGHGAAAYAVGSSVTEVRLYAVAGGWIQYGPATWTSPRVAVVTLGGIAIEWLAAALCGWAARRRGGWLGLGLEAAAWGLAIHGGLYLAIGAADGVGDGQWLYRTLGPARVVVVIPATIAVVLAGAVAARRLGGQLLATLPMATRGRRAAGLAAALAVAGVVHGGAVAVELAVRADPTYARVMATEASRAIDRELAAWRAAAAADGSYRASAEPAVRRAIAARHQRPRYGGWIAGAAALAIALGFVLARARGHAPLPAAVVGRTVTVAVAAIVLVVAIDRAAAGFW
jgi:hypothetical protein